MTLLSMRRWSAGLVLPLVLMAGPAWAAPLKSPQDVKVALRLMMQVTNDFARQINRKTYNRLPHENKEFHEATDALRSAVAGEPADFRAHVEGPLKTAVSHAQAIADESGTATEPKLREDHARMLRDVNAVFAQFPADLRPDPNVQPGGGPRR